MTNILQRVAMVLFAFLVTVLTAVPVQLFAQVAAPVLPLPVYNGGGIAAGAGQAANGIQGVSGSNIRMTIGNIINTALSYAALAATAVIIIAGFYLILGLGDEGAKDKAKKIVLYTFIGILILLTAKVIVQFFIDLPQ